MRPATFRIGGDLEVGRLGFGAMPSQVALAWLLARSPVVVPIPGTSRIEHLEENLAARELRLGEWAGR